MLRPLPEGTFWTVTCIGRHHFRMQALALLRGAPGSAPGSRTSPTSRAGVHAESNAQLVGMLADLARTLGREVATHEQAPELLGLG